MENSNRLIVIGTSLVVTLSIVTMLLATISQIANIYSELGDVKVPIIQNVNEFVKYGNVNEKVEMDGVDLLNTIKKYSNNAQVKINCRGVEVKKYIYYTNLYNDVEAAYSSWTEYLSNSFDKPEKHKIKYNVYAVKGENNSVTIYFI